jgi:hypothetical protein
VYCLWIAMVANRVGFMRSGFGRIERAKQPVAFWTLISFAVLISPLTLVGLIVLTRGW